MLVASLCFSLAQAAVRTITATGESRRGDNDTCGDAKRLALLDAKRLVLGQAGTYLESVTEVKNLQVSHDEVIRLRGLSLPHRGASPRLRFSASLLPDDGTRTV